MADLLGWVVSRIVVTVLKGATNDKFLPPPSLTYTDMVTPDMSSAADLETEKCLWEYITPGSDVSARWPAWASLLTLFPRPSTSRYDIYLVPVVVLYSDTHRRHNHR
jgi:hypothetical protein